MDREVIKRLQELEEPELSRIKGKALGKLSKTKNSPEAFEKLSKIEWFNVQGVDFEIVDGQFLISDDLIGDIPEDEEKEKIQMASNFIRDYLKCLAEALSESSEIPQENIWENAFLIGITERRR